MVIKATQLRANIFRILDEALATGQPVEIERKGHRLKLIPLQSGSKLSRLKKRKIFHGDPDAFVHMDWSSEWNHDLP